MDILKKVFITIQGYDLIRPGETVICAVSGGPDSVTMLHVLKELNGLENKSWTIIVAHINHGLRGKESDEDEAFVEEISRKLGLSFVMKKINVKSLKKKQKLSIEEAARKLRHSALHDIALKYGAKKIALGHTFDDQAETILFRVVRGTGLRGLKGIPPIRLLSKKEDLFLIRPFIEVERKEILEYLKQKNLSYRTDSSNFDVAITRNYIRQDLIPGIEKRLNPRVKFALVKLGQIARSAYIVLREMATEILENIRTIGREGEVCLRADEFAKFPPAIQTLLVDRAIKLITGVLPQVNFDQYVGVISLASEYGHGKVIQLPHGLVAKRESYLIKIYKPVKVEPPSVFVRKRLSIPGSTIIKRLSIEIGSQIKEGKVEGLTEFIREKDFHEEVIDYDRVKLPLTIRMRKGGDTFRPLGSPGRCKLKEFFIGQKVPREYRDRIPLVVDKEERIVWVVGYRISEDVKVTDSTKKILRLQVKRLDEKTAK